MVNPSVVDALFDEILELRRKNDVLLDRLHQCKRRNMEDKVKLRNTIAKQLEYLKGWEDNDCD